MFDALLHDLESALQDPKVYILVWMLQSNILGFLGVFGRKCLVDYCNSKECSLVSNECEFTMQDIKVLLLNLKAPAGMWKGSAALKGRWFVLKASLAISESLYCYTMGNLCIFIPCQTYYPLALTSQDKTVYCLSQVTG